MNRSRRAAGEMRLQNEYSMDMIGHDHELVEGYAVVAGRDRLPVFENDAADPKQPDLATFDLTENAAAIMSADGHKVGARLRIVEFRQSDPTSSAIGRARQGHAGWRLFV